MNALRRLFTPPRFLAMPAAGIEISDACIRALALSGTPGALRVAWWAEEAFPHGAVVGGVLRDKGVIVSALKKIRAEHHFDFAHLAIPEQQSYVFEISVPASTREEARLAVELRLEENVPLRVTDAVFDITPIPAVSAVSSERSYGVAVVQRKIVELYLAACDAADIAPLSFGIEPVTVTRAVVSMRDRHTLLIANLSEDGAGFYVVMGHTVHFSSTVPLNAEQYTASTGDRVLHTLGTEAVRVRDFWNEHHEKSGQKIHGVIACGCGAVYPQVIAALSAALHVPVEQALVWRNAFSLERTVPPLSHDDSLRFAGAIGLALRSFLYV